MAEEWAALLLSVAEVARRVGVEPQTVYRAIHEGRLQAVKVGSVYLVHVDALAAYQPSYGPPHVRAATKRERA